MSLQPKVVIHNHLTRDGEANTEMKGLAQNVTFCAGELRQMAVSGQVTDADIARVRQAVKLLESVVY